ncbi:hypothetical protein [Paenibacillus rhizolycopersici]|uniref:hypothetical protein n=1 Tax=Paenibacillus rhizolycopersici TaxID=2780073 RepID=UPI003D2D722F
MEDFYFAYGYDPKQNTAHRLYRFINGNFERYDPIGGIWNPDPEQSRIFIGEDWDYEEITEEKVSSLQIIF